MKNAFGTGLRDWRQRRRMSQLDLSMAADVSARHISFLETGRARPTRGMVLRLCERLDVPRADRNRLLTDAGLAPAYIARQLADADVAPVRAAIDWMLTRHAPYPAFAVNRHWEIVQMNSPASQLFERVDLSLGDSLIDALICNETMCGALANLDEIRALSARRLRLESAHLGGDPILDAGAQALEAELPTAADPKVLPPVIPARYRIGGATLSLFATIAQLGTAEDIALSDLRIELMFPADEATASTLRALAN